MQELKHRPEHDLATTSKLPTRNNGKIFEASLFLGPEMFQNGFPGVSWGLFSAHGQKCSKMVLGASWGLFSAQ